MTRFPAKAGAVCAATIFLLGLAAVFGAAATAGPANPASSASSAGSAGSASSANSASSASSAGQAALTYRGGGQGAVIFDHQLHAAKGFVCRDCHTDYAGTGKQLFQTQKQGLIDQAVHNRDASCFACHNGAVASNACETCHRRP